LVFLTPAVLLGRAIGLIIGLRFMNLPMRGRLIEWATPRPVQRRLTLDPRSHIDLIGILMALIAVWVGQTCASQSTCLLSQ